MNTISSLALLAHDRGWDGPPWPFVPIIPILVIATIWWIASRRGWGNPRVSGESVLAERYARGEIDEPEYRARGDALRRRR